MTQPKSDRMRVDGDLVRQLADLLAEKDLSAIEVEDGERRIYVQRASAASATHVLAPASSAATTQPAPPSLASDPVESADAGAHPGSVRSPMVGTAFLSPEPGAAAFAGVGTSVKEGDTVVIIEAMKVMNAIPSPRSGTVRQVLVQDSQPVEYDQPLMIIE